MGGKGSLQLLPTHRSHDISNQFTKREGINKQRSREEGAPIGRVSAPFALCSIFLCFSHDVLPLIDFQCSKTTQNSSSPETDQVGRFADFFDTRTASATSALRLS